LLGRLLPLFTGARRVEDLFTEAVARLFERRPELCLAWLDDLEVITSGPKENRRRIHITTQKTFLALEEHDSGSRPDMIVEVYETSEGTDLEGLIEVVMIESKIGSAEGEDQLKRYASHLSDMSGTRKTLVYITRAYDPKDEQEMLSEVGGVCFKQVRWHDFYRFLQSAETDTLVEEVMLFMEKQGMAQTHRLSTADLLTLARMPRAFEIFDETLGDDVKAELESFAGTKVKGQTHGVNHIRWHWRYIIIASLHEWDLFCFVGYTMDDPEEHPGITVNLESRPNAIARETSVTAMRRMVERRDWEGYDLDSPSDWAGVCRWVSLTELLAEEDHVAAVKRFFIESIGQLKDELTDFKKSHPELPWSGG
jgi:PD-(D/E)XK nuclease superfamily